MEILRYIIAGLLLLVLELLYFRVADRFGIVDRPNERSSHTVLTRRGGGVIFPVGMLLFFLLSGFCYPWFFLGLMLVAVVEFADDIRSVPNSVRLVVQFAGMGLMFLQLGLFAGLPWWYILVALVLCVGVVNVYNFMDGINGITGGYSLSVLLPLLWLNSRLDFIDMRLLGITVAAALVFCVFNFRKRALCFAGDVGSVSMAFIIVFAVGSLVLKTGDLSWLVLLVVYGVDAVLTICHRVMLHENLGVAHRKHAYQLMANELKLPHVLVSSMYALLQLAISAGAIFLPLNRWIYLAAVLVVLAVAYMIFMRRYYPLHEAYLKSKGK